VGAEWPARTELRKGQRRSNPLDQWKKKILRCRESEKPESLEVMFDGVDQEEVWAKNARQSSVFFQLEMGT